MKQDFITPSPPKISYHPKWNKILSFMKNDPYYVLSYPNTTLTHFILAWAQLKLNTYLLTHIMDTDCITNKPTIKIEIEMKNKKINNNNRKERWTMRIEF
jgi:hypothetical protein